MHAPSRSLRVLFVVQGEGRGHMTQALALAQMLWRRGHKVTEAIVGASDRREVPGFFRDGLAARIHRIASPNFVSGADGRIQLGQTVLHALGEWPRYAPSVDAIGDTIEAAEPDVVVNFYEGLAGVYATLRTVDVPMVAVGHQFMFDHPDYPFAPGQRAQRLAMRGFTRLAGQGADIRLALSFYKASPIADGRTRVVPPLLRSALFGLADRPTDGSLLVYLMEPRMAHQLVAWSDRQPDVRIHCFSDVSAHEHSASLTFHALHGQRFLERMAVARGVVCTAGFESVSEAMWLGTPALMVPTPGHYEQRCNAGDAEAVGAGLASETLDLDAFVDHLEHGPPPDPEPFRAWVSQAEGRVVGAIEEVAGQMPPIIGDGLAAAVNLRVT
ncbi:MAG: glycosyltransferase family protein [Rubricoccaceae bacterium]